jgi:hypothetical protein
VWILGLSARRIQEVVTQTKEAAVSTGLVIKESTTKYTKINKNINKIYRKMDRYLKGFRILAI